MSRPWVVVSNCIRSLVLVGLLFAILFGLVFAGTWLYEGVKLGFKAEQAVVTAKAMATLLWMTPYVIVSGVVWIAVALIFSGYMIRWSSACDIVEPGTEPRLEGILTRLCLKAQMDVPQLGIIDSDELNAYATGIFKSDYLVAVTRGLAARLTDDEIEGVMAHELAHIKNRDVVLSVMAATVAGGIALFAQLLFFGMTRSICFVAAMACGDEDEDGPGSAIGAWVAMGLGFLLVLFASTISTIIQFALSRSREFLADAGAAEMTGNPRALITALQKVSEDCDIGAPSGVMQMCIDRPRGLIDLFSTHPPIEDRIAALKTLPQKVAASSGGPGRPAPARRIGGMPAPAGLKTRAAFGQRR